MATGDLFKGPQGPLYEAGGQLYHLYKHRTASGFDKGKPLGTLPRVADGLPAACEKLREWLMESLADNSGTEVSRYAVLSERSGFYLPQIHYGPCHARLGNIEGPIVALLTSPNVDVWPTWNESGASRSSNGVDCFDREDYPEEANMFWEWLVNSSPFSGCFTEKLSAEEAGQRGVFLSVHAPGNLVSQAITASRLPHEFPIRIRIWATLVKEGVDPVVALALSECYGVVVSSDRPILSVRGRRGDIHDMFSSEMRVSCLKNLAELNIVNPTSPLIDKCSFGRQHGMWKSPGKSQLLATLAGGFARKEVKRVKWSWNHMSLIDLPSTSSAPFKDAVPDIVKIARAIQEEVYA